MNADVKEEESREQGRAILIFAAAVFFTILTWIVSKQTDSLAFDVAFLLSATIVLSIVIWQACDPFSDAAQWVGTRLRLPSSVRGATLDAVASSMPELFAGIFFVVVALASNDEISERMRQSTEGFGSTIATCAGSSIYNMILIPAICAIAISYARKHRPDIEIEDDVIHRDGAWVLAMQLGLLVVLCLPAIHWWVAVLGLTCYLVYILHLYIDTSRFRRRPVASPSSESGTLLNDTVSEEQPGEAEAFFGLVRVRLSGVSATMVLLTCTLLVAIACYALVELTNELAASLSVPPFFVAVILAAAASSIPDTLLSLGSARRGDDSGAISNVFGSNIFDICVGMSVPLLVCCYLNDWQPLRMGEGEARTAQGVIGLRTMLFVLTGTVMFCLWKYKRVTRRMGFAFVGLYGIFVLYAVLSGLGIIAF